MPGAPQLNGKVQNVGLLDINAAISWVHSNVAAFGGNPDRISLFGQSTGAGVVDMFTYSHVNDTRVKGEQFFGLSHCLTISNTTTSIQGIICESGA